MENIKKKIEELRSLKAMAEELAAEITSIEDEIKAFMGDEEEIRAGDYKVRYKTVRSSRFDSTAFRRRTRRSTRSTPGRPLQDGFPLREGVKRWSCIH